MAEHLIFFNDEWVTDASDEGWQQRVAVACDWPQEVRIFRTPAQIPTPDADAAAAAAATTATEA